MRAKQPDSRSVPGSLARAGVRHARTVASSAKTLILNHDRCTRFTFPRSTQRALRRGLVSKQMSRIVAGRQATPTPSVCLSSWVALPPFDPLGAGTSCMIPTIPSSSHSCWPASTRWETR